MPTVRKTARRVAAAALLVALSLTGCTPGGPSEPSETSTPTPAPRPFTVATTDQITVSDPAAITDAASSVVAYNVFQRLMTLAPGTTDPKPDAAQECRFDTQLSLLCTLKDELRFHNGDPLTSADVKFSIERALRLDVPGSSTSALSSLRQIQTPDPRTVRFVLSRVDNQFVYALASPAASIVAKSVYDPDQVRGLGEAMVGSGPFTVSYFDNDQLQLASYANYRGFAGAGLEALVLRRFADSAAVETAMRDRVVDVVWRALNSAAIDRLRAELGQNPQARTSTGFAPVEVPGARVRQLWWHTESPQRGDAKLRTLIAQVLQEDRVLTSLVPNLVAGQVASFEVGAGAEPDTGSGPRRQMTLAYDPTDPDAAEQANQIRMRLEDTGAMSVRLIRATPETSQRADLALVDLKAWTFTALAWLQPFLDQSLDSKATDQLEAAARTELGAGAATSASLAQLQQAAGEQLIMLPITQQNESIFIAEGYSFDIATLAPGWQLGLWGIRPA